VTSQRYCVLFVVGRKWHRVCTE